MGIDYVICAAGEGTRTKVINPFIPKPLLKIQDQTLLEISLQSIDFFPDDQLIILFQRKHQLDKLNQNLVSRFPYLNIIWVAVDHLTRGQAATAILAEPFLNQANSLVIFNADTFFRSRSLQKDLENLNIDGIIPVSIEPGNEWSFCQASITGLNRVESVKEKVRISDLCSVGYYFFRKSESFFRLANRSVSADEQSERYVAPFYNCLIESGQTVIYNKVDIFKPMGSLEQLRLYWNLGIENMRKFNPCGTLVVDLDNTLTIEDPCMRYSDKTPNLEVIKKLQELSDLGFEIIIYTSRRMKTHKNSEAHIIADIGWETLSWLKKHHVPFSGLKFGKPYAENGFYVDDKAILPKDLLDLDMSAILKSGRPTDLQSRN